MFLGDDWGEEEEPDCFLVIENADAAGEYGKIGLILFFDVNFKTKEERFFEIDSFLFFFCCFCLTADEKDLELEFWFEVEDWEIGLLGICGESWFLDVSPKEQKEADLIIWKNILFPRHLKKKTRKKLRHLRMATLLYLIRMSMRFWATCTPSP